MIGTRNVRARLAQTDAGPCAIAIDTVTTITIGFAQQWLAWHDEEKFSVKRGNYIVSRANADFTSRAEDRPRPHPMDCSGISDGQNRRRCGRRRLARWALGRFRQCRQRSA